MVPGVDGVVAAVVAVVGVRPCFEVLYGCCVDGALGDSEELTCVLDFVLYGVFVGVFPA